MNFKLPFPSERGWVLAVCLLLFVSSAAQAKDWKLEAVLVWATSAEKSPNPNHKPVDAEVKQKLSELPLKWKNYFEVHRETFNVRQGGATQVTLSEKCKLDVKHADGKNAEVSLIGKGEQVLKRIQPLPKGEMLVLGGNAPDETGWLVVLKRLE